MDRRTSLTGTSAALPSAGVQRRNYRPPAPTLTGLLEAAAVEPDVDGSPLGGAERLDPPALQQVAARAALWALGTDEPLLRPLLGCSTGRRRGRFPRATSVGGRSGSPFVLRVSHKTSSRFTVGWRRRRHSVAQRTTLPATTGPAMRSSRRSNSLRSAAATRDSSCSPISRLEPSTRNDRSPSPARCCGQVTALTHLPPIYQDAREESVTPLRWVGAKRNRATVFVVCPCVLAARDVPEWGGVRCGGIRPE